MYVNSPLSGRDWGTDLTFAQSILPIGAFATTLTTLSLSLMEWRGVTTTNVYIANFFFIAAFGLVVTAQWELAIGNGLAYSVYSAFGVFPPAPWCEAEMSFQLRKNSER